MSATKAVIDFSNAGDPLTAHDRIAQQHARLSARAQGLSVKVTDPAGIDRIAALLCGRQP